MIKYLYKNNNHMEPGISFYRNDSVLINKSSEILNNDRFANINFQPLIPATNINLKKEIDLENKLIQVMTLKEQLNNENIITFNELNESDYGSLDLVDLNEKYATFDRHNEKILNDIEWAIDKFTLEDLIISNNNEE